MDSITNIKENYYILTKDNRDYLLKIKIYFNEEKRITWKPT